MREFFKICVLLALFSCVSIAYAAQPKQAPPPGFIALSESSMNWSDAVAYCQRQCGRLPRINNSDSWDGGGVDWSFRGVDNRVTIDGFGVRGTPWPFDMPNGVYWTGTSSGTPNLPWVVRVFDGIIYVSPDLPSHARRVVCVRSEMMHRAPNSEEH